MMFDDDEMTRADMLAEQYDDETATEELEEHALPTDDAPIYQASSDLFLAHAALLDNAVISLREQVDLYRLVRTHLPRLQEWHERHTGWRIQRHSTFFRLERHLHVVSTIFLDDKLKRARDFTCLAWLLWFAEKRYLAGGGRNQQFLLSQLVDDLQQQSQAIPGQPLDFRNQQDRYSMWRALDYLARLGGLQTLDGEVKRWAEDENQPDNEVLYEFTPMAHSLIEAFNEQRVASILSSSAQMTTGTLPLTITRPVVQTQYYPPPLVRAWRTLLLGPALYRLDDPEAFALLLSRAEQVSEELSRSFGWLLELNRDYACIVRGGTLSAGSGPVISPNSALDQMWLLLCSAIRTQVEQGQWIADEYGCLHVSSRDILPLFHEVRQRYITNWGATVKNTPVPDLLRDLFERMRQCGIVRGPDADENMLILPTAARYSVDYEQKTSSAIASSPKVPSSKASTVKTTARSRKKETSASTKGQEAFDW